MQTEMEEVRRRPPVPQRPYCQVYSEISKRFVQAVTGAKLSPRAIAKLSKTFPQIIPLLKDDHEAIKKLKDSEVSLLADTIGYTWKSHHMSQMPDPHMSNIVIASAGRPRFSLLRKRDRK